MSLFNLVRRRGSAPAARERLQILLEYERSLIDQSDLLMILREEILAVVDRHVTVDRDRVQVRIVRGDVVSVLKVGIEIPNSMPLAPGVHP